MKRYFVHFHTTLSRTLRSFSPKERAVFVSLLGLATIGLVGSLGSIYHRITVSVPVHGGSFSEAIVGTPRFINPLLALSEADRTMVNLVYSGLLRKDVQGNFVPDLADTMTVSDDGTAYTLTLKQDAVFQDRTPVTADDIIFSVTKAQESELKSPLRAAWQGVTVEKKDDQTIVFTLDQPYSDFPETLTMGILPKHAWEDMTTPELLFSKQNAAPIGSGPYRIVHVSKDKEGIPTTYTLRAFSKFALGKPYLSKVTIVFAQSEEDAIRLYKKGTVDAINSFTPGLDITNTISKKGDRLVATPLPRVFGIFFNKSKNPVLADPEIVHAFDIAINKSEIVETVLGGYGTPLSGPLPPTLQKTTTPSWSESTLATATSILEKRGWKKNPTTGMREKIVNGKAMPLGFALATGNATDLETTAELIRKDLEKIGVTVSVQPFETGNLEQDIIRNRAYEALLFGQIIPAETDLYAFWHSSQKNDPGLNISMYSNQMVDKLLSDIVATTDLNSRHQEALTAGTLITKDRPAIFLYAPDALYALPRDLRNISLDAVAKPSDHVLGIANWYRQTDRVLPFLLPKP